jgi:hypothetical protein
MRMRKMIADGMSEGEAEQAVLNSRVIPSAPYDSGAESGGRSGERRSSGGMSSETSASIVTGVLGFLAETAIEIITDN